MKKIEELIKEIQYVNTPPDSNKYRLITNTDDTPEEYISHVISAYAAGIANKTIICKEARDSFGNRLEGCIAVFCENSCTEEEIKLFWHNELLCTKYFRNK